MLDLRRLAQWGVGASGALLLAIYAGTTQTGHERATVALAQMRDAIHPSGAPRFRALDAKEGRQLAERVKFLLADRDDLVTRLAIAERGAAEAKSSLARVEKIAEEIKQFQQEARNGRAVPDDVTSSIAAPDQASQPSTPADAAAATGTPAASGKVEFGLDLGSANTLEGLRTLWTNARRRHSVVLDGLRPIVHLRERAKPSPFDLRLVAGPIPNAAAAARLCATLTAARAVCQPTTFDGQNLVVR